MDNITLDQAIQIGRVYVLNKSKPKGDILITFVEPGTGKNFVATIPKTWIPIAISDNVPLSVLDSSIDFRSYLKSRMLTLIPRQEAEKLLESNDAKDELERIYTSKYTEDAKKKQKKHIEDDKRSEDDEVDIQDFIKTENLLVKDILERNQTNKASVTLNELRSIEEELTQNDLEYVVKKAEGKVRSWAEKALKDRFSGEYVGDEEE